MTDRRPSWKVPLVGAGVIAVLGAMILSPSQPTPGCTPEDLAEAGRSRFSLELADYVVTYDQQLARRVAKMWNERDDARLEARRAACTAPDPDRALLACLDRIDRFADVAIDVENVRGRDAFQRAFSVISALPDASTCTSGNGELANDLDVAALDADVRRVTAALTYASEMLGEGRSSDALGFLDTIETTAVAGGVFVNEIELLRATALMQLGRVDEAFALHRSAWDRALANDSPLDAARAASGLAFIVGYLREDPDAGLEWVRHGQTQLARVGSVPVIEGELVGVSGVLLGMKGESELGLAALERALTLVPNVPHHEVSRILLEENAATIQAVLHDPGAEERLRRILAWKEERLGPDHPDLAHSLHMLGYYESTQLELDSADALLNRALELSRAAVDPDELLQAKIHTALAGVAISRVDIPATFTALEHADEIYRRLLGPDHPALGSTAHMRLALLVQAGEIEAADQFANLVRDRLAVHAAAGTSGSIDVDYLLAHIDLAMRRPEKSIPRMAEAIDRAQSLPAYHAKLAFWSGQLAKAYGMVGELDAAIEWTERAASYYAEHGGAPSDAELIAGLRKAIARQQADRHGAQ